LLQKKIPNQRGFRLFFDLKTSPSLSLQGFYLHSDPARLHWTGEDFIYTYKKVKIIRPGTVTATTCISKFRVIGGLRLNFRATA
jgi:hypothetical protein